MAETCYVRHAQTVSNGLFCEEVPLTLSLIEVVCILLCFGDDLNDKDNEKIANMPIEFSVEQNRTLEAML